MAYSPLAARRTTSAVAAQLSPGGFAGGTGVRIPGPPKGSVAGAAIAGGLWLAYQWWQTGSEAKIVHSLMGPWQLERPCSTVPASTPTYTAEVDMNPKSHTGFYSSGTCQTTFRVGYLGEPWPPVAWLNNPSNKLFHRKLWYDWINNNTGQVTEYARVWENWRRIGNDVTLVIPDIRPVGVIDLPGIAPGVGATNVRPYPYVSAGSRRRGFTKPFNPPQVSIFVRDNVIVRPETTTREHRPPPGSREVKGRTVKGVAGLVFWTYENMDDAASWIAILAKSMGWKDNGFGDPEIMQQIEFLRDPVHWSDFNAKDFAVGFAKWYLNEIIQGRVIGKIEQDFLDKIGRDLITLGGATPGVDYGSIGGDIIDWFVSQAG